MAPDQAPLSTTHLSASAPPFTRSNTVPVVPQYRTNAPDRNHLAPEDAIYAYSPPRRQSPAVSKVQRDLRGNPIDGGGRGTRRGRYKDRTQGGSRRKGTWKKLLWVKQSCKYEASKIQEYQLMACRSGQLHRSGNFPRTSTAKPTSTTLRFLASSCGFNCHCSACL